jgi:hypothetical protein
MPSASCIDEPLELREQFSGLLENLIDCDGNRSTAEGGQMIRKRCGDILGRKCRAGDAIQRLHSPVTEMQADGSTAVCHFNVGRAT